MNAKLLEEIYALCPGGICIKPYNASAGGSDVTIQAKVSVKHPKHGTYCYAEVYVSRDTLEKAIESTAHMVKGYKALVDAAP